MFLDSVFQARHILVEHERHELADVEPELCLHPIEISICKGLVVLSGTAIELFRPIAIQEIVGK